MLCRLPRENEAYIYMSTRRVSSPARGGDQTRHASKDVQVGAERFFCNNSEPRSYKSRRTSATAEFAAVRKIFNPEAPSLESVVGMKAVTVEASADRRLSTRLEKR